MYLCIDTTTSEAGITLVGESVWQKPLDPRNASESILAIIDELIQKAGIQLTDLKGVFVIKGPGSFTGLRVGISVANQFAHQLNIPIVGLRTDEWWAMRTNEADTFYLQTMNRSEVYVSQKSKPEFQPIIPVEKLSDFGTMKWMGELSDDHLKQLPNGFIKTGILRSAEETWEHIVQNLKPCVEQSRDIETRNSNNYDLIEPYYGKEPMITKSKRKLSI